MDPTSHIEKLFGADDSGYIPPHHIVPLLKLAWSGGIPSDGIRAVCWRVLLGLLSSSDKSLWENQLIHMIDSYNSVKTTVLPSLDKVSVDPLSSLSSGETQNNEWSIYYKNVDLINFIKTDLDRLYITGIPDEYFESPARRDMLLAILLIWSFDHPVISYRQGMHEMAGYIMFCVEAELSAFNALRATATASKPANDPYGLLNVINEANVEANAYHIFVRIMNELEPLYDPVSLTPRGAENQPFVVQFSTKVQEHYLRQLDSELCHHLEECHISAQIYGLRWCRLLLGREFTQGLLFKLWDFLFACCFEAENFSNESLLDIDARPNTHSVLAAVRVEGRTQHSNEERRNTSSLGTVKHESPNESSAPAVPNYVCTPLLGALGDLMLAMMLHVREQMLEGDSSTVLGLLMHYPALGSATPILDYADMIKRGVIMGPPSRQAKHHNKKLPPQHNVPLRLAPSAANGNSNSGAPSPSPGNLSWNLHGMKQKLMAAATAMGNGINEMVNNLAEMAEEEDPHHSHSSHADGKTRRPSTTKSLFSASPSVSATRNELKSEKNGSPGAERSSSKAVPSTPSTVAPIAVVTSLPPPSSVPAPAAPVIGTHVTDPGALESSALSTKSDTSVSFLDNDPLAVSTTSNDVSTRSQSALSDPLSLLLAPTGDSSTPSLVPQTLFAPSSPKLTGKGTGYRNMPGDVVQPEDRDPFHLTTNPANAADLAALTSPSLRSTFFTKEWFPGSTAKKDKNPRRENRSSGGVDLHVLHTRTTRTAGTESSSDVEPSDSESEGGHSSSQLRSVRAQVDRNAVGDRLLDLADSLASPVYTSMPSTITSGREVEYEVALRRDTVRKLRAIADVLAGLTTLADFDSTFPAPEPSPTPRHAGKASAVSPLPPVREKGESVDLTRLSFEIEPRSDDEEMGEAEVVAAAPDVTSATTHTHDVPESQAEQEVDVFSPAETAAEVVRSESEEQDTLL